MVSLGEKISIIMGIYNSKNKSIMDKAINSVLNQSYINIELIICDDGSTDDTWRYLYGKYHLDYRIVLIRNENNCGLAYSLNKCLNLATGTYIARMDDDDISDFYRLEKQYEFLKNNKEYGFVGCSSKLINGNVVWGERKMIEKPSKYDFLMNSPFMHPTIMFRKQAILDVNGYRVIKETRRMEDYDLFMRLYQKGYFGYNIQDFLFYYREDQESYKKRKYKYRVDEAKIRYMNYDKLGVLPKGYIYILKPLVVGLLPYRLINILRRSSGNGYTNT